LDTRKEPWDPKEIEERLRGLLGLKLVSTVRAADMRRFNFGSMQGEQEYALHVQCAWRIETAAGVRTGRADLFVPLDEKFYQDPAFDQWDPTGDTSIANLQDSRVDEWMQEAAEKRVAWVQADAMGGFVLGFSEGSRLAVFPCSSRGEAWRIFRPGCHESHYVVEQ
jgi:hypothetical protein